MLAALCETAEEAALVPEAAEIAAAVDRALGLAGDERPELRAALDATREAALAAAVYDDGLRVARTGYVDQLGDAARALGASAQDLQQRGAELSASLSGSPATLPTRSPAQSGTCSTASRSRARRSASATRWVTPRRPSRRSPRTCWRTTAQIWTTRRPGMTTFDGRPVLITGGGTGMGRAFALALAERGASVAVCGRRAEPIEETAELCRAHGVGALASQVDVRDPERVEAWVAEAAGALGPPRMLINNAAGNFLAHAIDLSPNGWRAVIDIVLNGTFYCSTAVARSMREAGVGGSILNVIASYAWTGNPMTAHSAAAKAGVWNLARSLAVEWAPLGIRVNCIAPGPLDSEGAAERLFPTPEIRDKMLADIPDRRFTTLEDVVASALFLLSDDAAHITGETLTIDGGQALSQGMFRHSPIPQR